MFTKTNSPHIVFVPVFGFFDDELSVKQDEAAHDEQPQIHVGLERHRAQERMHIWSHVPRSCYYSHMLVRYELNGTLKNMTEPKKTLKRDMRKSRERPDIRVPGDNNDSELFCYYYNC